jgi:hypothetical protein
MYSMKLQPGSSFVWERELVDHDYIVVNHEETPLREENVLRTRALVYKKVTDDLAPESLAYAISPTGCDRRLASAPNTIEVVKISIPRGLFLTSIIQSRYKNRMYKSLFYFATGQ